MLGNYGITGGVGLILGVALVWWVRPDTSPGTIFLIFVVVIACFVARSIGLALFKLKRRYGFSSTER